VTVTVLDLRTGGDRPPRLAGRVVVIDDAAALIKHSAAYVDLMSDPMIGSLVCVAVGDIGGANPLDGVALTVPNALRETTVLWVGDQRGVRWAPPGTPIRDDAAADGLDDLIAALRVSDVFDEVAGDELRPRFVASPAVRLTVGPADPADLAEAGAAAVHALCVAETAASRDLVDEIGRIDAEHDPARPVLSGQLAAARDDARRRLHRVSDLLRELGEYGGAWLFTGAERRPSALVGTAIVRAGQAAENYRRILGETLNRMDGHLQGGHPPVEEVMALGVADPLPARHPEIATGLHDLVDRRLRGRVALPLLAQELRAAAAFTRPQGVSRLFDRVRGLGGLSLEPPAFRWWPSGVVLLPAILLSCAAMVAFTGTSRTDLGYAAGLAVLWWVLGWFLLARRPTPEGERGFGPSSGVALAGHLLTGVAGVALGFGLANSGTGLPHVPQPWVLFAGLVVLAILLGALAWMRAVGGWRDQVPLDALETTVGTLDEVTELACRTEWQPMRRRRAIASAAEAVAGGLESMARTLDSVGDQLFAAAPAAGRRVAGTAGPIARPGAQDLYAVVHADLAALCEEALRPVWSAAAAGRNADDGDSAVRLKHALDGYAAEVAREGLMGSPAATGEPDPRDELAGMLAQSPAVVETLRIGPRDEMTQLCTGRQLSYLSSAGAPSLVRFAPRQLKRVLGGGPRPPEDGSVVWTEHGEYAGALRLVPLRPESVRGEF
jgi:hypothetical protein